MNMNCNDYYMNILIQLGWLSATTRVLREALYNVQRAHEDTEISSNAWSCEVHTSCEI